MHFTAQNPTCTTCTGKTLSNYRRANQIFEGFTILNLILYFDVQQQLPVVLNTSDGNKYKCSQRLLVTFMIICKRQLYSILTMQLETWNDYHDKILNLLLFVQCTLLCDIVVLIYRLNTHTSPGNEKHLPELLKKSNIIARLSATVLQCHLLGATTCTSHNDFTHSLKFHLFLQNCHYVQ